MRPSPLIFYADETLLRPRGVCHSFTPQHVPGLPFNAAAFSSSSPEIPPPRTDGRRHALTLAPPTYCALRSCYNLDPGRSPRTRLVALRTQRGIKAYAQLVELASPSHRALHPSARYFFEARRCYSGRSLAAAKWEARHARARRTWPWI